MTNKGFAVTFERMLPHGDDEDICEPDERGFVIEDCSLRDALVLGLEADRHYVAGQCEPSDSRPDEVRWLTFYRWNDCTRENLEQGISENRALHIPASVTPASRRRICRLFN